MHPVQCLKTANVTVQKVSYMACHSWKFQLFRLLLRATSYRDWLHAISNRLRLQHQVSKNEWHQIFLGVTGRHQ